MVSAAWGGVREADKILLIIDASRGYDGDSRGIIKRLTEKNQKAMLAINKIDLVAKPKLLKLTNELNSSAVFTDIFMISAELGDGVDDLMAHLIKDIPAGPWLFPEDQISDMPGRLTASEITREKLYLQLYQELPYAASVETEGWKEQKDDSIRIEQVIYVERASQKAIILGKGGSRIKALGKASREELEEIFEKRVHLFLFVKVREKWGDDPERYRDLGLDFDA
jgi:GTP-binding protein Era